MFQSLNGLPPRAVVDTNTLLNACFLPGGAAAQALAQFKVSGFTAYIDEAILAECQTVLLRKQIELRLKNNPSLALSEYLNAAGIMLMPAIFTGAKNSVNNADQHVYQAARQFGAFVLTEDLKLTAEMQDTELRVRNPRDILLSARIKSGQDPQVSDVFGEPQLGQHSGSILARAWTGGWSSSSYHSEHTLCQIENLLWLKYSMPANCWVLDTTLGIVAKIHVPVKHNEEWLVGAHYHSNITSGKTSLVLRVSSGAKNGNDSVSGKGVFTASSPGIISRGHSIEHAHYWNGSIARLIMSPGTISGNTWAALKKTPNSSPDPSASNALNTALKRWDAR